MKWYYQILIALLFIIIGFGIGYIVFDKDPPEFERKAEMYIDTIGKAQSYIIDTLKTEKIIIKYEYKIDSIIISDLPDSALVPEFRKRTDNMERYYDKYNSR